MGFKRMIAKFAVGLVAASAVLIVHPGGASAQEATDTPTQVGTNALASCSTFRIESVATNLAIRYQPNISSSAITVAQRGWRYDCVWFSPNGYTLGGRYTACGVTNGNGWIGVAFYQSDGSILVGYTYQACVKDV